VQAQVLGQVLVLEQVQELLPLELPMQLELPRPEMGSSS
jgi:hypothetical protein